MVQSIEIPEWIKRALLRVHVKNSALVETKEIFEFMRHLNPEGENGSIFDSSSSSSQSDFLRVSQTIQKPRELRPTLSVSLFKPLSQRNLDPQFKEVWVYLIKPECTKAEIELLSQEKYEMH